MQISAKISQHSEEHVHHLLIYTCDLTGVDISVQGLCNAQRIPRCTGSGDLIGAWAIGGQV